jgi:hypothetical protein
MEPTDSRTRSTTLSAYDFAMEELSVASSKLSRALLASTLTKGAKPESECSEARRVYDKMIELYPRVRLDAAQRASLLQELALLRSRLEECEDEHGRTISRQRV